MSPDPALRALLRHRIHPHLSIDVDLQIGPELGVLFGASGAGKTSILRMIAGLLLPDAGLVCVRGTVLFDSQHQINRKLRERLVGFVFQDGVLFPHLSVEGNIRFGLRGLPRREAAARADEVADLCGIATLRSRRIETLSGGERQRVGLARAIAPRPRILLCDEPVSALDINARYHLLHRLRQIQRTEQIPVMLVTHAVDEAMSFGDHLWLLKDGRIEVQGHPRDVFTALASRSLLGTSRLQNVFMGVTSSIDPASRSAVVKLDGGPSLVVASGSCIIGERVILRVDAEEIVVAFGPLGPMSARNRLAGFIEQVWVHEGAAEIAVRVERLTWMVGITTAAVASLRLQEGDAVTLIIKARSCQLLTDGGQT